MTSYDVMEDLLRKRQPKRIGLNDSPWGETLTRWSAEGYPVDKNGCPADPIQQFGYDMCTVGGFFDVMPIAGGAETLEETEEWVLKRTGAGATFRWWKKHSGTPEHVHFRMTNRKIWEEEYRPHLLQVDRRRLDMPVHDIAGTSVEGMDIAGTRKNLAERKAQGVWTYYGHWFIWSTMQMSLGDLCMYETLLADPEWLHDYNRVYTDFYKAHIKLLIEEAGKPDGFWIYEDLGYRRGLFCSLATLEDLFLPYFKEIVDFLHGYDLPIVLHSCGGITEAVPLFIQAGFDALNPMEVKAGCDALALAEKYGDHLAFVGGLDVRVLESGDQALIRSKTVELLEGMKAVGARYIFGSDHSLTPSISYRDYQYALDVYREHMMY